MTRSIEVPLDSGYAHDLDAMRAAIEPGTTVVYLCNPNNPTGTIVSGAAIAEFVDSVPESVLVVVDEAYHDFVTDPSYASALPLALTRPNVVVLRTFSKVFALASHRVGYGVASPATIIELRKAQAPFSVSQVAQAAAVASLADRAELERRVKANEVERQRVLEALRDREITHTDSQANFVYFQTSLPSAEAAAAFIHHGVIVRPMSGSWLRVTLGSEGENDRLLRVLDEVRSTA